VRNVATDRPQISHHDRYREAVAGLCYFRTVSVQGQNRHLLRVNASVKTGVIDVDTAENSANLLTFSEVQSILRVSGKTLRSIIARGDLPAHKVGAHWRVRSSDLCLYSLRPALEAEPTSEANLRVQRPNPFALWAQLLADPRRRFASRRLGPRGFEVVSRI